ncbi:MAG: tetratricopeptide (TPR) repeat protein [Flavobacteriales bacterium]
MSYTDPERRFLNVFRKNIQHSLLLVLLVLLAGCSTKKKGFVNRAYHNVTAKYNGYFNGRESLKEGVRALNKANKDNFEEILSIYPLGTKADAQSVYPQMDRAIEKASVVIKKHSMLIKGKEYCNWIDDSYLLIGKSNFYKRDLMASHEIFTYMVKQYKDKKSRYDGHLWLIRANIELLRFKDGEKEILLLEQDEKLPKKKKVVLAVATAEYYLKQADYNMAIPKLEAALEVSKRGKQRNRMNYILGQLYQEKDDDRASEFFTKVIKRNTPYDMEFNARINRALMASAASGDLASIKKELKKMSRDDKNADYLDRIYFAMADIAKDEEDIPLAKKYLTRSIQASTNNPVQKAISYFTMADIYFDEREYPKSALYFDSSMTSLPEEHKHYDRVKAQRDNLADLIKNLDIIAYQDSMILLSDMSDAEIDDIIADIIQSVIQEEEQEAALALNEGANSRPQDQPRSIGGSSWYYYNQTAKSYGVQEFKNKWGERKLEDNWRRRNKQSTAISEDDELASLDDSTATELKKTPEFYLQNVPRTEGAIDSAHMALEGALYNLGVIYKDQIGDLERSIESFESYLERYPRGRYTLETYYQLYLLGIQDGRPELSAKYKQKVISEYPDSDYAKILTDPTYLAKLEAMKGELARIYNRAYDNYQEGEYELTLAGCDTALLAFEKDELVPKFALLKAMAIGKTDRLIAYRRALEGVVEKYPTTPEKDKAEELLGYVKQMMGEGAPKEKDASKEEPGKDKGKVEQPDKGGKQGEKESNKKPEIIDQEESKDSSEPQEPSSAETATNDSITEAKATLKYEYVEAHKHFYLIVITDPKTDSKNLQSALSDFNSEFFSLERLSIKTAKLGREMNMVYVRGFKKTDKCKDYFSTVKGNEDVFNGLDPESFKQFIISQPNFTKFFSDRNIERYETFFNENYSFE